MNSTPIFGIVHLSPVHHILKSIVLRESHIEFSQFGGEFHSDIPPMPWLNLVLVDVFSFLITLSPSIQMSISLKPLDVGNIFWIFIVFFFGTCIEEIYCESELMFGVSRWCTETIGTFSEIPHPFLISSTSISRYHNEGFSECDMKVTSHIPK